MKKYFLKVISFIISKFRKKMTNLQMLDAHKKTMGILFDYLTNECFAKGEFGSIQFIEMRGNCLDFYIAGEKFTIKAVNALPNQLIGTNFTVYYNEINPDNYPTYKLQSLPKFDFNSENGNSFKFSTAMSDTGNIPMKVDTFANLLLQNLIGYMYAPDKIGFILFFGYKLN